MKNMLFELISPERLVFSGEVRAVMLPAMAGDMTVMWGHEPTFAGLNPGIVVTTDIQGHGFRSFIRGGFAQITHDTVTVLASRILPPEELTRERIDEEILRLQTMRDGSDEDADLRKIDFDLSRLDHIRTTLSF